MNYRRALSAVCVLALGIACSSPKNAPLGPAPRTAETVPKAPAPVPQAEHDALEERVFAFTQRERQRQGLPPLQPDGTLASIARLHSEDMLRHGYFSHEDRQGRSPDERIAQGHRRLIGLTAENLWMGSGYAGIALDDIAATMIDSWLKSPGHRRNLLNPEYTRLGVGIAQENGEVRVTQCFAFATAFLETPLPSTVNSGQPLDLRATSAAPNLNSPVQAAFKHTSGREAGPVTLGDAVRLDLNKGTYRLLFYTPDSRPGRYTIYLGPSLEVR